MISNEISVIGLRNITHYRASKICNEITHQNTEDTKRLGFKVIEKKKTLPIMCWIPKIR